MIEIIYAFKVKPGSEGLFELAFGPGGMWSRLYAKSDGFRGTAVLRDVETPQKYLVMDHWDSEVHRAKAVAARQREQAEMEAAFDAWVDAQTKIGTFRLLSQASVRSQRKSSQTRNKRYRPG